MTLNLQRTPSPRLLSIMLQTGSGQLGSSLEGFAWREAVITGAPPEVFLPVLPSDGWRVLPADLQVYPPIWRAGGRLANTLLGMNAWGSYWWWVNIGLCNGLLLSGNKPLRESWPRSMWPYGVTSPQWVNTLWRGQNGCHFADRSRYRNGNSLPRSECVTMIQDGDGNNR